MVCDDLQNIENHSNCRNRLEAILVLVLWVLSDILVLSGTRASCPLGALAHPRATRHRCFLPNGRSRTFLCCTAPSLPVHWALRPILVLCGTGTPDQWVQRLKRVFNIARGTRSLCFVVIHVFDVETSGECGVQPNVIVSIDHTDVRRKAMWE